VARPSSLDHPGGLQKPQTDQEDHHILPRTRRRMDHHHLHPVARIEQAQATVLALWSLGMVSARACALTAVSTLLATLLQRKEQSVRQQLASGTTRPRPNGVPRQRRRRARGSRGGASASSARAGSGHAPA
jgi:hypothetical protein